MTSYTTSFKKKALPDLQRAGSFDKIPGVYQHNPDERWQVARIVELKTCLRVTFVKHPDPATALPLLPTLDDRLCLSTAARP